MNGTAVDWEFDFSSLPRWDNRNELWGVYDKFFEIPQSDTLCCLYSIYEATMCNYLGFLAVLRNKEEPRLVLNSTVNFCINFSVNSEGNLIFLQPYLHNWTTNQSQCPILILDIEKNQFAFLRTANRCPGYKVVQKNKSVFVIEADEYQRKHNKALKALHGKKIRINWLRWHEMYRLDSLGDLVFRKETTVSQGESSK